MRLLTLLWLLAIPAFAQAPTPGPYLGLTKYTALIVRDYVSAGTFIGDGSQLTGISGTSGGGASPSLPLNGVQYNNAGNFGASSSFTFTAGLLTAPTISASAFNGGTFSGNGAGLTNVAAASVPYAGISGIPAPVAAVAAGTALTMQDLSTTTLSATTADIRTLQSGLVSTTALSATTALLTNLTVTACTGCSAGGGTQISTTSNNNQSNVSGSANYGFNAGLGTGTSITAIGAGALRALTTGIWNTAVGANALGLVSNGSENVGVGYAAGSQSTGSSNVYLGSWAGRDATTGSGNTFVGHQAANAATTAFGNTCLGSNTCNGLSTGNNNLVIGVDGVTTNVVTGAGTKQLNLANAVWGSFASGINNANTLGINITNPSVAWEVSGTISATTVTVNSPTTLPICTAAKAGNMWYNGITKCLNYCDGTANRQVTSVVGSCT